MKLSITAGAMWQQYKIRLHNEWNCKLNHGVCMNSHSIIQNTRTFTRNNMDISNLLPCFKLKWL